MIITESKLRELTPQVRILNEATAQRRTFSALHSNFSVFLSHKHTDIDYLNRARQILERLSAYVYVDWADPAMQHPTNRETAERLKQKIRQYDKFIFLASDAAIASRWCNWEIGFGDAHKYATDKIAIFPIKQDNRDWTGSEFLQLYPSIEYYDGTTRYSDTHNLIPEGFYVKYHFDRNIILPLIEWLAK